MLRRNFTLFCTPVVTGASAACQSHQVLPRVEPFIPNIMTVEERNRLIKHIKEVDLPRLKALEEGDREALKRIAGLEKELVEQERQGPK